jgi:hypothetical protein
MKITARGALLGTRVEATWEDGNLLVEPHSAWEWLKGVEGTQRFTPAWPSLDEPDLKTPMGFCVTFGATMDEGSATFQGDVPKPTALPKGALA